MVNRVIPFAEDPPPGPRLPLRGALMMIAGCAALTVNDACVNALVAERPAAQVTTLRAIFGLGFVLLLSLRIGGPRSLVPRRPRTAAILTGLMIFGLFLFPLSQVYLPLADAIMLTYLSPAIVAMASPVLLGERVGWRRWGAVALGLLGAGLVIRPEGGSWQWAALLPVAVACAVAARDLLTRRTLQGETTFALVAAAHLGAALLGLISLFSGWDAFTGQDWALLVTASATLTLAQVLMVGAFRHTEATVLSCLKYSSIVWAVAFGWIFFGEAMTPFDWAGAVLIAISGVVILQRQKLRAEGHPPGGT